MSDLRQYSKDHLLVFKKELEKDYKKFQAKNLSLAEKDKRLKHPARKTFQAIRIEVNHELDVIKPALESATEMLRDLEKSLKNPPISREDLLKRFNVRTPEFVKLLRPHLSENIIRL